MNARYYFANRPPMIGTHPTEGLVGQPQAYPNQQTIGPADGSRQVWGSAEYDGPLSFHNVWKYELIPADMLERIVYRLWRHYEDNTALAANIVASYWALSDRELEAEAERGDMTANLVKLLKAEGYHWNAFLRVLNERTVQAQAEA